MKEDFSWAKEDDRILAVLILGSVVEGEDHVKSDIDLTVVVPGASYFYYDCEGVSGETVEISEILMKVFREVNVVTKNYDVHIFEELPLHIQMDIIENHEVIFTKDKYGMSEYFYRYRKLWGDQRHRNTMTEEEIEAAI